MIFDFKIFETRFKNAKFTVKMEEEEKGVEHKGQFGIFELIKLLIQGRQRL